MSAPPTHADYQLSQLDQLEAESIHIFREVAAEFEKPVLMFSGGKDSIVMLRLAEKAFYPAKIPFPVLQVDTGYDFPEVLRLPRLLGQPARRPPDRRQRRGGDRGRHRRRRRQDQPQPAPDRHPAQRASRRTASPPPSVAGAATRRRPAPRSASTPTATSSASGTPRCSAPSCGASTTAASTRASTCGSSRCPTGPSSTSGTTSAARRSRSRRSTSPTSAGSSSATGCCSRESEFNPLRAGETVEERTVRFRTVGDLTLTGCVESEADTIDKIIDEIAIARVTERGATRGDDRFSEAAMEDRKKEGYF